MNEADGRLVFRVSVGDGTVGFFAHSFFFYSHILSILLCPMHSFFPSPLSLNRIHPAHTYVAYLPSRKARDVTNMAQL